MLRQPKKQDRMYAVEIGNNAETIMEPCIYAQNPKQAVVFALKKNGYNIGYKDVLSSSNQFAAVAKVCLLGGICESVSYYFVHLK